MSDRTQMLSVERLEALARDFEAGGAAERDADEPGVPSSVYYDCAEKLRAALSQPEQEDHVCSIHSHEATGGAVASCSCGWKGKVCVDRVSAERSVDTHRAARPSQPEHQGENGSVRDAATEVLALMDESESSSKLSRDEWVQQGERFFAAKDALAAALAHPHPPTPVLSDEEGERLEEIAYGLETGYFRDESSVVVKFASDAADLLRNLASRGRGWSRGGQYERCPRCNRPGTPRGNFREGTEWNCESCGLPFKVIDPKPPEGAVK
jgi:hypothetical protein